MPKPPRASDPLMLATQLSSSPAATLPPVRQTTNWCLVVAPTYFAQNPETFQDNAFMQTKACDRATSHATSHATSLTHDMPTGYSSQTVSTCGSTQCLQGTDRHPHVHR